MTDLASTLGPIRAGRNLVYFAEVVLGVRLNPAQKRWFYLLAQADNGWGWLNRFVAHVAANQIGKTLGLAIAILWAANSKIGVNNVGWDFWLNAPYKWYHLAPSQGQADMVRQDMVQLLNGNHPAQFDPSTGERRSFLWLDGLATEVKFDKYYPGILLWNGAQIHFRTSEDQASAIQGVRAAGVSFDEAAYEQHLQHILNKVLRLRVIASQGPIWMVSTPDGINDWFEIVSALLNTAKKTIHDRVWENPAGREALVWSHVSDNVGYGLTAEAVEYMEEHITESKEQSLRGAFLAPTEAFFVPQDDILKAWRVDLPDRQEPKAGHRYVAFWDPSVSADPTVVHIIDVTGPEWIGVYFERWEEPLAFPELMQEMYSLHRKWNGVKRGHLISSCTTGFDATSMGGTIIKQHLQRMSPKRPVNFAGHVKIDALTDLRSALFARLRLPSSWLRTKREILGYRLLDKKLVQDCVMSLAGAAYMATSKGPGFTAKTIDPGYNAPVWG